MKFEILGKPVPWMRAGRYGKRYFDHQLTKKKAIRTLVQSQMKSKKPFSEPLKLSVEFHMRIPTSWSKIKRLNALKKPHSTIPDLDNLTKFIDDALNGVLWTDDAIIYEFSARKYFGKEAKTVFTVEPYRGEGLTALPGLEDGSIKLN